MSSRTTTHLLKPGPVSTLSTRCGLLARKAKKSDLLGAEDNIQAIDCAGCLRELVVEMRLKAMGELPPLAKGEPSAEAKWLAGGDTGISSQTIWSVMTRHPVARVGYPLDPADFGRCHRLLEQFPAWRARMPEVAARHPAWAGLVAEWDALTALYLRDLPTGKFPELYERMQQIENAPRAQTTEQGR
jgi:hypothetical protein